MMSHRSNRRGKSRTALVHNPLENEQLLLDAFYGERRPAAPAPLPPLAPPEPPVAQTKLKPSHYKIVSISLYNEDIERLERLVGELKRRGHHKANKSQLIRQALEQIDLDQVAKER